MSNVNNDDYHDGGDGDDGNNNDGNKSPLDDFLDPRKSNSESENLKRARAQMSETSLPINFGLDENEDEEVEEDELSNDLIDEETVNAFLDQIESQSNNNSQDSNDPTDNENNPEATSSSNNDVPSVNPQDTAALLKTNPYLSVVSKLSPSDLISKFTSTAHPRVQDAVRATILGLIGNLPKMAFETTTVTTGERLASLMFQLQMTGYMFKNAEYRLSLSQSLGIVSQSKYMLPGSDTDEDEEEEEDLSSGKIRGKIKVTYGPKKEAKDVINADVSSADNDDDNNSGDDEDDSAPTNPEMQVEVDAAAYMSELRAEVSKLKDELSETRAAKEEAIRKDLLLYIKTLPEQQLKALTGTMSDDVLMAMKGLVNVVMSGIGDGDEIGPETVTEQSGEAMAQLCMWQLVVGYNMRELEVREEMKLALRAGSLDSASSQDNGGAEEEEEDPPQDGSIDFGAGGFE